MTMIRMLLAAAVLLATTSDAPAFHAKPLVSQAHSSTVVAAAH